MNNKLTDRERAVIELAGRGMSDEQIARQLGISVWTVRSHLRNSYEKLGVSNRSAAAYALRSASA
jgi:RNA polymerase sigma factor (sigma-70 family)